MNRVFSNGRPEDILINAYRKLYEHSSQLQLAAPYFTLADPVLEAIAEGKSVQLLVGLNPTTSPNQLRMVHDNPGVTIRYLTKRFHAKIFLSGNAALVGSSNLTRGGFYSNREAVVYLDKPEDGETVDELRNLFNELWGAGAVLTKETLNTFARTYKWLSEKTPDWEGELKKRIDPVEPPSIRVGGGERSKEQEFLQRLRRKVYEQYRPAFREVTAILNDGGFRRDDLFDLGETHETNRFLNYVRVTHAIGVESWRSAPLRDADERRLQIVGLGREWASAVDNKVHEDYRDWLARVVGIFGTPDALEGATKEQIMDGLMSLHAFTSQLRFVEGGAKNLPSEFWKLNNDDVARVRSTLSHLLYGPGEFIRRLQDVLSDPEMKLSLFGQFCALELYGTVKPEECPPLNGRIAKALRYLGFFVEGS